METRRDQRTLLLEIEQLRTSNFRLGSTVQELRLEISYYQGETKKLEREKNILKQDVSKMSALFKGWLAELQSSNTRSVIEDPDFVSMLVKFPSRSISEVLQLKDVSVLITTCQSPFYVEHVNKAWIEKCGWESHEILGLTCAFLQGEAAAAFTKNIKEVGYGNMRVYNYRKNGELYCATVTVFPVYDSIAPTGPDSDIPVLTHFATILSEYAVQSCGPPPIVPGSVSQYLTNNLTPMGPRGAPNGKFDRRLQSRKFDAKCHMSPENFLKLAGSIRVSDLLRLMLSCQDALVLTDDFYRIIHINAPWAELTGYSLSDVEGKTFEILQGAMTDLSEVLRVSALNKAGQPGQMRIVNYAKDGMMFTNNVTIVPIRGGYKNNDITHYCALAIPDRPSFNSRRWSIGSGNPSGNKAPATATSRLGNFSGPAIGSNGTAMLKDACTMDFSSPSSSSSFAAPAAPGIAGIDGVGGVGGINGNGSFASSSSSFKIQSVGSAFSTPSIGSGFSKRPSSANLPANDFSSASTQHFASPSFEQSSTPTTSSTAALTSSSSSSSSSSSVQGGAPKRVSESFLAGFDSAVHTALLSDRFARANSNNDGGGDADKMSAPSRNSVGHNNNNSDGMNFSTGSLAHMGYSASRRGSFNQRPSKQRSESSDSMATDDSSSNSGGGTTSEGSNDAKKEDSNGSTMDVTNSNLSGCAVAAAALGAEIIRSEAAADQRGDAEIAGEMGKMFGDSAI